MEVTEIRPSALARHFYHGQVTWVDAIATSLQRLALIIPGGRS
jgi:hypothetical protein